MAKTYDIPYPQNINVSWGKVLTADTSMEAPSANGVVVADGGAEGLRIDKIKVRALGANVATVIRFFVNDGQGVAPANFAFQYDKALPAVTAPAATAECGTDYDITITQNSTETAPPIQYLEAGQKLYASLGTTVASGYMVTVYGGHY